VVAIDAVAGRTYTTSTGRYPPLFHDADGNRISMPIPSSGRYYFILDHRGPLTITITESESEG